MKNNWPTKKLGEVLDYEQPTKYLVSSTDYKDEYSIPVLTAGKSFILGNTNEKSGVFPKGKLPVIIFDDFTTAIKFVDFPFKVKSSAMKILHAKKSVADIKYLFNKLLTIKFPHNQHKRYWISECSKLEIPLPPLATQKQIAERLDKIAEAQKLNDELIQKSDELFHSLLHQELNLTGKDWEFKKLSEASFITSGGTPSRKKPEFYGGTIPWVKSGELKDGFIWDTEEKITDEAVNKSSAKLFPIDTVLIAMYGATVGKVGMLKTSATTNQAIAGIQPKKDILNPYFIFYFFLLIAPILVKKSVGGAQPNINQGIIKNTKIPFPPLAIQKQIVEKLSAVQDYKTQLLAQKSKLKELFDSSLAKSMASDKKSKDA